MPDWCATLWSCAYTAFAMCDYFTVWLAQRKSSRIWFGATWVQILHQTPRKLAQLVERSLYRRFVAGSIPALSTNTPALGKGTLLWTRRLQAGVRFGRNPKTVQILYLTSSRDVGVPSDSDGASAILVLGVWRSHSSLTWVCPFAFHIRQNERHIWSLLIFSRLPLGSWGKAKAILIQFSRCEQLRSWAGIRPHLTVNTYIGEFENWFFTWFY